MNRQANSKASLVGRPGRGSALLLAAAALAAVSLTVQAAGASPEDEVRATFDRFVAAQNAHDIKAVEGLLLPAPTFLWITRGAPIWGQEAALKRFAALYEGTWRLDPDPSGLKVMIIGEGAAQI